MERLRHDACYSKLGNICTIRDYVEIMSANFYLEIQSEHFGNGRSLSIEGCNIKIVDKELNGTCELYSHFSDDSCKDVSTTHVHIISILEELKKIHQLKDRSAIIESTDECYKQYRYGIALLFYLLFLLTLILSLIV